MERPMNKNMEVNDLVMTDALLLAGQYKFMLQQKEYLEAVMRGVPVYTKEMAIRELSMGGGGNDGERVQNSNISNIPERIAILLSEGYVEKQNRRIRDDVEKNMAEYHRLCQDLHIIQVAMRERMSARTRAVFIQLYERELPWGKIKDEFRNSLHREQVTRERNKAVEAIAEELLLRRSLEEQEG